LKLSVQLRRESFVVGKDQGGRCTCLDDIRDGESLAGPGHAEQGLVSEAGAEAIDQLFDRLGLIARRRMTYEL